jgi:hypothetical protein
MSLAFIRQSQRTCSHCKQTGHNLPNCDKATVDATAFHRHLLNIYNENSGRERQHLTSYIGMLNVHDLSILMRFLSSVRMRNRLGRLVKLLIERNKITEAESHFRYKRDRVKVLMWYYWFSKPDHKNKSTTPKLNIIPKSFETVTDLSEFNCPICTDCKPGKERTVSNCNHSVCKTCMVDYLQHHVTNVNFPKPCCSLCRANITSLTFADTDFMEEASKKYFKPIIPATVVVVA